MTFLGAKFFRGLCLPPFPHSLVIRQLPVITTPWKRIMRCKQRVVKYVKMLHLSAHGLMHWQRMIEYLREINITAFVLSPCVTVPIFVHLSSSKLQSGPSANFRSDGKKGTGEGKEEEKRRGGKEERIMERKREGSERKGERTEKRERENGRAQPVCYRLFRFSPLHLIGPFKLKARRQIDHRVTAVYGPINGRRCNWTNIGGITGGKRRHLPPLFSRA